MNSYRRETALQGAL